MAEPGEERRMRLEDLEPRALERRVELRLVEVPVLAVAEALEHRRRHEPAERLHGGAGALAGAHFPERADDPRGPPIREEDRVAAGLQRPPARRQQRLGRCMPVERVHADEDVEPARASRRPTLPIPQAMSRTLIARGLSVAGTDRPTSPTISAIIASYGPNRVTTASYVTPYVTAIMCSSVARTRMASPPPTGGTPVTGCAVCGVLLCEFTSPLRVLPRPDQEARVVEEGPAHLQHAEARAFEVCREGVLVPVVRADGLADRLEDRVGQDPEEAAQRGGRSVAPPDLAQGGPASDLPRVIHEDRVPTRLQDPARLLEERVGCRMDVERVDADDLVECALAERVAAGEVRVAEGQVREVLGATLLLGHLDQRGIGVEPDHGEAGLGE